MRKKIFDMMTATTLFLHLSDLGVCIGPNGLHPGNDLSYKQIPLQEKVEWGYVGRSEVTIGILGINLSVFLQIYI